MSQLVSGPKVSVIMPAYNAARTISSAIESVRAQTFDDWELLIIDDASSDSTAEIAYRAAACDMRIHIVTAHSSHELARGPGPARNLGLQEARGRYIAFLDADDFWRHDKLERQLRVLHDSNSAFCFSSYVIFNEGEQFGRVFSVPETITFESMLAGSVIGCSTVIYDRATLGVQRFDDGSAQLARSLWRYVFTRLGHEDYVAWMRLLRDIEARGLPPAQGVAEPLVFYRKSSGSFSASKWRAAGYQFFNYSEMLGLRGWRLWRSFGSYVLRGLTKRWRLAGVVELPAEVRV